MAITWGSAKGNSTTKFKVGVEVLAPTPSGPTVTITTNIYVHVKDAVNDSSVTLAYSGNAVPTTSPETVTVSTPSNSDWSTKNIKLVKTLTLRMATPSGPVALVANASLTGLNAAGASNKPYAKGTATLKPPPYTAPAAPTDLLAEIVPGGVDLSWTNTNPESLTSPYTWVDIERWDNQKNAWYLLVPIGPVESYTDTSVGEDRQYQYRVRGRNIGGSSSFITSALLETAPAVPNAPSASRPAVNVEVSWINNSSVVREWEVWHAEDGVLDGAPLATVANTFYTHTTASTSTSHQYFLKAVGASLTSAMSAGSVVVPALAASLSPTILSPLGTILDAASPITLAFTHNTSDGTNQTGFKPRWREQGTDTWTLPAGLVLSASNSGNVVTSAGHGFNTGDIVRFTGTMPTGLSTGVQYFAIPLTPTTFMVASTLENAEDGIPHTISSNGSFSVRTGRIVSNVGLYTIPGGQLAPAKAWEWDVSTDGRYAGVQPSSPRSIGGFRTASKPTLTFSTPEDGDTVTSPKAFVGFTFFSADEGVVQQWAEVSLWRGSTLLEIYESSGEWSVFQFEYNLTNGSEYRIEVQAEGSNGIRSDIYAATFTADYIGPATPGLALTWDVDDGLVIIDITNPDDEDAPAAATNDLYRSTGGESYELMLKGISTNTTVIDYLPTPNAVNTYKVIARAVDGTTETYEAAVDCQNSGEWYWLNGGDNFDLIAKVRYEAGTNRTLEREKTLHTFDGRTHPVAFTGPLRTRTIEITALLTRDDDGYAAEAALEAIVDAGGDVYYRDPTGKRVRCSIQGIEVGDRENLMDFRATLTEVAA